MDFKYLESCCDLKSSDKPGVTKFPGMKFTNNVLDIEIEANVCFLNYVSLHFHDALSNSIVCHSTVKNCYNII